MSPSPTDIALLVAGASTAGFVQGLAGFGFGMVSMSFWAWGLVPQQAAVLATVGGLIGQMLAVLTVRRGFDAALLWPFVAGGLCGLPLGLLLLQHADVTLFRAFVGTLLAVWCPVMLLSDRLPPLRGGGRWADALAGAAGGVMGPLGGFTGTLPSLWCTLRRWDRDRQRATMQNFNLALLGATSLAYVGRGLATVEVLPALAVVAASLVPTALLGMRLYVGISEARFRQVVLSLLTASGVAMLLSLLR